MSSTVKLQTDIRATEQLALQRIGTIRVKKQKSQKKYKDEEFSSVIVILCFQKLLHFRITIVSLLGSFLDLCCSYIIHVCALSIRPVPHFCDRISTTIADLISTGWDFIGQKKHGIDQLAEIGTKFRVDGIVCSLWVDCEDFQYRSTVLQSCWVVHTNRVYN